jgi:hypothetical protein
MYGLRLAAPWIPDGAAADVTIRIADRETLTFPDTSSLLPNLDPHAVFTHVRLPDGGRYLRWRRLVECIISPDGNEILLRALGRDGIATFQSHLLAPTLSFVFLDRGREVLHGGAVALDDEHGIAILGQSGAGKSTVAAALIAHGARSVTDDLLVLPERDGRVHVLTGPARLKLYPSVAARLLNGTRESLPLNPFTTKRVYALRDAEVAPRPPVLKCFWALSGERRGAKWQAQRLAGAAAVRRLVASTFITLETTPERQAQLLRFASRLAELVPVYSVTMPRGLQRLRDQLPEMGRNLCR